MIIRTPQTDEHVASRLIVTDPLDEAAARRVGAGERFEIDGAAVFDV